MDKLLASGYQGSLDIEIRCPAEKLEEEYGFTLSYLQSALPPGQALQETHV